MTWSSSSSSSCLCLKATCVGFLKGHLLIAGLIMQGEVAAHFGYVQDIMIWAQGSACRLVINSVHWTLIVLLQRGCRSYLLLPSLIDAKSSQQPNSNQKSSNMPVKGRVSICTQTAKGFWRLKLTLKEHKLTQLKNSWPHITCPSYILVVCLPITPTGFSTTFAFSAYERIPSGVHQGHGWPSPSRKPLDESSGRGGNPFFDSRTLPVGLKTPRNSLTYIRSKSRQNAPSMVRSVALNIKHQQNTFWFWMGGG